jgi:hypothetical protein
MIDRDAGDPLAQPSSDPALQWAWAIRNLERLIKALHYHGHGGETDNDSGVQERTGLLAFQEQPVFFPIAW